MDRKRRRLTRVAAAGAVMLGLVAGSYGVASAASGSGSSTTGSSVGMARAGRTASAANAQQPWGAQRSDETLLTGDTKSKVQAAAEAKLPGATVVRVETDADGNAAYEVHMVQQDGTPATVYVDKQFGVVSVQTGMPAPPRQPAA
jgi:Peptidase propeptide and YPEB domain